MWIKWRKRFAGNDQLRWIAGAPIVVAYGFELIARAIAETKDGADGAQLLIVGVMRDDNTKRWHVGLSRAGRDFAWVSVFGSKQQAETQVEWITYAAQQNSLEDEASYAAFMRELQMSSEFEP